MSRGLNGSWLVAVLAISLGACVEDETEHTTITVSASDPSATDDMVIVGDDDPGDDPCALADALPTEDLCSLICHPDELAARMVEGGVRSHACYQLRCVLSDAMTVSVGVCLP
ncbi:MAG: hypothetical protein H0T46_28105 [Deltaproteobacteria bacterium]|nr:hypothetical protein [Deltaproteobacteria bacterium]